MIFGTPRRRYPNFCAWNAPWQAAHADSGWTCLFSIFAQVNIRKQVYKMATSRHFVQITDKEINKIKITCIKKLKQLLASGSVIFRLCRVVEYN